MIIFQGILSILLIGIIIITLLGIRSLNRSMKSFREFNGVGKRGVTVVMAARNEQNKIGKTLESLVKVDDKLEKIIVVNDRSTDNTREIIKKYMEIDKRIELLDIDKVPKSWVAKSYALYNGVKRAKYNNALLFLDADIEGDMQRIVNVASNIKEGELYTFMPYFETDNVISNSSQSFLSALLHGYFGYDRSVNKNSNYSLMFGCCWSIMPYTYYEVGGHASVKSDLMEDKNFATRAKSMGVNIIPIDGRDFIKTKSWNNVDDIKGLLSRIFFDYEKNLSNPINIYLLAIGLILLFYLPLIWIPLILIKQYLLSFISFMTYMIENIFFYLGGLTNKIKKPYSLLYFIPAYLLITGFIEAKRKGVIWKGETYKINS
ncbi:glycosyl transferase [Caldisphaera lagunensis DSM 15908]|uniref:Glycosyl transferase n=1 Tax=Caldisphaera lagunensis (strain DSM 15908 / JCM 11604 / ANMR 0165 / IC-154) TaxID=1056495 RepID=L0ABW1_CALLD|nr:glycosyltransferase family 2 protein [Caldisphaera lagunensis]AFZ70535.1 glycosyl transferase [Caldisphaera lagunensis DSM 15908]